MFRFSRLRGEEGASAFVTLLSSLGVVVFLFVAYKCIVAYADVNGMEADLNKVSNLLAIECVANPGCSDAIEGQIEEIRASLHPNVEVDYKTMEYAAAINVLTMKGSRVVDFKATRFTWRFVLRVDINR
jgi:hypothetical protein